MRVVAAGQGVAPLDPAAARKAEDKRLAEIKLYGTMQILLYERQIPLPHTACSDDNPACRQKQQGREELQWTLQLPRRLRMRPRNGDWRRYHSAAVLT